MIPVPRARRTTSAVVLLFTVALSSACSKDPGPGAGRAEGDLKRREPTRVRVAPVERREMARTLSTTTVVESEKEIKVFPRSVAGASVVTEVLAEEGDEVAEGDVLAVVDPRASQGLLDEARVQLAEARDAAQKAEIAVREAEAKVRSTQITYEQANREFERNEKTDLISQMALDVLRLKRDTTRAEHEAAELAVLRTQVESKAAATTIEKAELAVKRLELELSWTRITAPFSGVIASRTIRVGESVSTAVPAFVLTDLDDLRAVIHRPQRELSMFLGTVQGGDGAAPANGHGKALAPIEIRATAEALPGVDLVGEILLVSPSIEAQSGSFRVTVRLRAKDAASAGARLLPGMLVRLQIVTDRHPDALVVPKRALRREGEASLVFVVRDGVARRVHVEEGFSDEDSVELFAVPPSTLAPGEMVVVVGNRDLEDGAEVEPESSPAGPADEPASPAEPGDAAPADGK